MYTMRVHFVILFNHGYHSRYNFLDLSRVEIDVVGSNKNHLDPG